MGAEPSLLVHPERTGDFTVVSTTGFWKKGERALPGVAALMKA
jgi:hypothetical protein